MVRQLTSSLGIESEEGSKVGPLEPQGGPLEPHIGPFEPLVGPFKPQVGLFGLSDEF